MGKLLLKLHKKTIGIILVALTIFITFTPQFRAIVDFPKEIRMLEGESHTIELNLPGVLTLLSDSNGLLMANESILNNGTAKNISLREAINLQALGNGTTNIKVKLFGFIPVRDLTVNVFPKKYVIPGGHSIGVRISSKGVMVVDFARIKDKTGKQTSPAEGSGVRIGDRIMAINGVPIEGMDDLAKAVRDSQGKPLNLKIERGNTIFERVIDPILCEEENLYRIGMWVRDSAVGVGTLTFYDPETKKLGALGHVISDVDTGETIVVKDGKIINASVVAIQKGTRGRPGEKRSVFDERSSVIGFIEKNTPFGIFGSSSIEIENSVVDKAIPLGLISQIKQGPAEILTVVEGEEIERFNIEIVRVLQQNSPDTKGMIIKIIDPKLLEITGGIVQGMSGSPIIQDGKLIGAVTHVFVNDPTRGYGVFAEWMFSEANS